MRQAGRALPEYRKLREGVAMLDSCRDPDLTVEITLQPVRRYGVDAAIFLSDIVVPLAAIGDRLDIVAGTGPVIAEPIRDRAAVARLRPLEPADVPYMPRRWAVLVDELGATPLIGFAGAPFTLASYLIEGGPEPQLRPHQGPDVRRAGGLARAARGWPRSPASLAGAGRRRARARCSCSTAGPARSRRPTIASTSCRTAPHVLAGGPDVPRIHFGVGTGELLRAMGEAGADVVGVDWRVPLDEAASSASGPARRSRATSTPRAARALARDRREGAARSSSRRPLRRPHLQPRPRRIARDRSRRADPVVELVHELGSSPEKNDLPGTDRRRRDSGAVGRIGLTGQCFCHGAGAGRDRSVASCAADRSASRREPKRSCAACPKGIAAAAEADLELAHPAAVPARLWLDGKLLPLPGGTLLGVPGDLRAAAPVLGIRGTARALLDRVLPATQVDEDPAVGAVRTRAARRPGRRPACRSASRRGLRGPRRRAFAADDDPATGAGARRTFAARGRSPARPETDRGSRCLPPRSRAWEGSPSGWRRSAEPRSCWAAP